MKYADYTESYATFSEDKTRRFVLFRQWDKLKPVATIIGLNPSTADDEEDDPTIGFVYRVLNSKRLRRILYDQPIHDDYSAPEGISQG